MKSKDQAILGIFYATELSNLIGRDVICDIAIYADDTTVYFKCDQTSDQWQQLELASELESNLRNTVDQGKKWLVDFNAGKTQLLSFDQSNNNGSTDVNIDGSVLEEKSSFKILGLTFSSKLNWGSSITSITKTASKNIGALICSISFFLLKLLCISINLPYTQVWNTVVTSGLVSLVATWNCQTSYKNKYAGLLVLHLLLLLNPQLIIEMWPA